MIPLHERCICESSRWLFVSVDSGTDYLFNVSECGSLSGDIFDHLGLLTSPCESGSGCFFAVDGGRGCTLEELLASCA